MKVLALVLKSLAGMILALTVFALDVFLVYLAEAWVLQRDPNQEELGLGLVLVLGLELVLVLVWALVQGLASVQETGLALELDSDQDLP